MNAAKTKAIVLVRPPTRAGGAPQLAGHSRRSGATLAPVVVAGALIAACAADNGNQVQPPVVLGMTAEAPAYYSDQQVQLYEVQKQVPLPMRKPTDAEKGALGKADPYPRAPFLLASDTQIEIRFTITNLDTKPHSIELLLDPWNEFVHWEPGVTVVNDENTQPNFSGYDKFFVVPAQSRVEGTITADDTRELAIDLGTAENILKNPPAADAAVSASAMVNHVFNLQNRSNDGDPLITPFIPQVIAGLTGFDLGLRTYEPAAVAVEVVVDVTDLNGNRVLASGATDKPIGRPGTALMPPGARQGN